MKISGEPGDSALAAETDDARKATLGLGHRVDDALNGANPTPLLGAQRAADQPRQHALRWLERADGAAKESR
jgi:hypothetical protein